jgi:hypothetical protein
MFRDSPPYILSPITYAFYYIAAYVWYEIPV